MRFSVLFLIASSLPFFAFSQIDQSLKRELDIIYYKDQLYRQLIVNYENMSEKQKDSLSEKFDISKDFLIGFFWARQDSLDKVNQKMVVEILDTYGYPGKSLVGEPANEAAFYVIQHSLPLIEKYHRLVKGAADKGELPVRLWRLMDTRLNAKRDTILYIQEDGYAGLTDSIKNKLEAVKNYSVPKIETSSSSFRYYELADSFSKIQDTVNAEKHFRLVDSFHLLTMQVAYGSDIFMSRFALRDSVKLNRKKVFSTLSRSAYFDSFASYYLQVQNYKKAMGGNANIAYEDSLRRMDSIQQQYLWKYILKHGTWPTLSNGAVFAAIIASRDIEYFYKYVPFIVNAYNENKISSAQALQVIQNKYSYTYHMTVSANLHNKNVRYDFSSLLENGLPYMNATEIINKIAIDANKNCPVRNIFFVHYIKNVKNIGKHDYCNKMVSGDSGHSLLTLIEKNCPVFHNTPNGTGCSHYHLPNLMYDTEKLFFYITY